MSFPPGFKWGVASASYQVEGAPNEDGKGSSVWDMFCRRPGAIWGGQNGDVACDHYHRWRDDLALMRDLGIKAYRFSTSWPRVLPEGVGPVNQKGLDFYERLVDGMLAAGIEPWLTLFHWDYPLALYHCGGWLNRDSVKWFGEYAALMSHRLSDRVAHWMTLNEPPCYIELGLGRGIHAPGDKLNTEEVLLAAHHTLMAHGQAVREIRAAAKRPVKVGIAMVGGATIPATESEADISAARKAMFAMESRNMFNASWWMDPVCLGQYPADGLRFFGDAAPRPQPGDLELMHQPLDFLGLNIYNGQVYRAGPDGRPLQVPPGPGYPKTTQDYWPITPSVLYWGPRFAQERYRVPIVITENGHQNADVISLDGKVHDPQRIDYLHRHLRELRRAIDDGVRIDGYFQWCFTDNFEWAMGDAIRVGIVFTDYVTQKRVPKDSAYWYSQVIAANGNNL